MQCYSCYDASMYHYHGFNYKAAEDQKKYLEVYKKLRMPVIECDSCGARKKMIQKPDDRWQEVFVQTNEEAFPK